MIIYSKLGIATPIILELKNNAIRQDAYSAPMINKIIVPDLSEVPGFPASMIKISTGLYYYNFIIPIAQSSVGSFLVDIEYIDANSMITKNDFVQIIVTNSLGSRGGYTAGIV